VTVTPTSTYNTERVYTVPGPTVVTTPSTVVQTVPDQTVTVPGSAVVATPSPLIVTEAPTEAPAGPTRAADLVLAGEIRRMISDDGDLISAARNTRISIYNGIVTITGTTITRDQRERLHAAIESVPGIIKLDDRVRATLDRSY
jgi:hypothetical protein